MTPETKKKIEEIMPEILTYAGHEELEEKIRLALQSIAQEAVEAYKKELLEEVEKLIQTHRFAGAPNALNKVKDIIFQ